MGRTAQKVYTEPRDIERIEQLVTQLPSRANVRITMCNGDILTGWVMERPAAQLYEDPSGGATGMNGEVRLDDPAAPTWSVYLWLGDIERVETIPPH
jgi:hypothetical protein